MQVLRSYAIPLSCLLIASIVNLSLPQPLARAAMVGTEAVIALQADAGAEQTRVRAFLQRTEVRAQFEAYGVDPAEALARVDGLSDREVTEIAGRLDELPTGAGGELALVVLLLVAYLVLLVAETMLAFKNIADTLNTIAPGSGEPQGPCRHLKSWEKDDCEHLEQDRLEEAKRLEFERQAEIAERERQRAQQQAELERRARQGEPEAEFEFYSLTSGPASWKWLCLSANHGHPQAQVEMGRLYWYGLSPVREDLVRSYMWSSLAAAQGFEGGKVDVKDRRPLLTPEQHSEIERLVAEWEPDQAACEVEDITTTSTE